MAVGNNVVRRCQLLRADAGVVDTVWGTVLIVKVRIGLFSAKDA